MREKVIFAEIGLKADYLTCVQNSKTWPSDDKPIVSPRFWHCSRCWGGWWGHGNHQMRHTVLSDLEAHHLSGLEAGHSPEEMMDHSWEVSRARQKQNQLWSFLKVEIKMQVNWELHPQSLRSDKEAAGMSEGTLQPWVPTHLHLHSGASEMECLCLPKLRWWKSQRRCHGVRRRGLWEVIRI